MNAGGSVGAYVWLRARARWPIPLPTLLTTMMHTVRRCVARRPARRGPTPPLAAGRALATAFTGTPRSDAVAAASTTAAASSSADADEAAATTASGQRIADVFASMDYGPAPESEASARAWIEGHGGKFGFFADNAWEHPPGRAYAPAHDPATGEAVAASLQALPEDVDACVAAARRAQPAWAALPGHARARHIYALARHLQKHHRLLAVLEALDNGKPVREARDADVPLPVKVPRNT